MYTDHKKTMSAMMSPCESHSLVQQEEDQNLDSDTESFASDSDAYDSDLNDSDLNDSEDSSSDDNCEEPRDASADDPAAVLRELKTVKAQLEGIAATLARVSKRAACHCHAAGPSQRPSKRRSFHAQDDDASRTEPPTRTKNEGKPATLSHKVKTLHDLWREYTVGIDGNTPAKDFTPAQLRGRRSLYDFRSVAWMCIKGHIKDGKSAEDAIETIYDTYGHGLPYTKIIAAIRRDNIKRTGKYRRRAHG